MICSMITPVNDHLMNSAVSVVSMLDDECVLCANECTLSAILSLKMFTLYVKNLDPLKVMADLPDLREWTSEPSDLDVCMSS